MGQCFSTLDERILFYQKENTPRRERSLAEASHRPEAAYWFWKEPNKKGSIVSMPNRRTPKRQSLTALLKTELSVCESLREVERETGVNRLSLARFLNDTQSLRLDNADRLAKYFGIEHRMRRKR